MFSWVPTTGQSGSYPLEITACDGVLTSSRLATLKVYANDDTDFDQMPDEWELAHFCTLERDGTGDFDGDGISDLDEYLRGLDPREPDWVNHWTLKDSISVSSNWQTVVLTDT